MRKRLCQIMLAFGFLIIPGVSAEKALTSGPLELPFSQVQNLEFIASQARPVGDYEGFDIKKEVQRAEEMNGPGLIRDREVYQPTAEITGFSASEMQMHSLWSQWLEEIDSSLPFENKGFLIEYDTQNESPVVHLVEDETCSIKVKSVEPQEDKSAYFLKVYFKGENYLLSPIDTNMAAGKSLGSESYLELSWDLEFGMRSLFVTQTEVSTGSLNIQSTSLKGCIFKSNKFFEQERIKQQESILGAI